MIPIIHLGVGGRGRHWLGFIADHPDFTSVACIDPDQRALEAARGLPGLQNCKFFTGFEQALQEANAEAVLIASPSFLHGRQALQALDAGLAVMVEKPFSLDLGEALAVVDRAQAVRRPVLVAENYRFFQAERTVSPAAGRRRGRPGRRRALHRSTRPAQRHSGRLGAADRGAVHHRDRGPSLRQLPLSVRSRAGSHARQLLSAPLSDYRGRAALDAVIEMADGLLIQYAGTMVATRYEFGLWVEGSDGELGPIAARSGGGRRRRRFFRRAKLVPVPAGDEARYPKGGTVSLLNQFRDALTRGQAPETSGADNLWTLAMVEASMRSAREGRRVEIAEVFAPRCRRGPEEPRQELGHDRRGRGRPAPARPRRGPRCGRRRADRAVVCRGGAAAHRRHARPGHLGAHGHHRRRAACLGLALDLHRRAAGRPRALPRLCREAGPPGPGPSPPRGQPGAVPVAAAERSRPPLGDHGCVHDLPAAGLRGRQIVEWGTWSWFTEPAIIPASLGKEMRERFGPYPAEDHSKIGMVPLPDPEGSAAACSLR